MAAAHAVLLRLKWRLPVVGVRSRWQRSWEASSSRFWRGLQSIGEGKYEVGEEVGSGFDAVVYKGRNVETSEEVAIKVFDKDHIRLVGEVRMQERLTREIYAMMSVRHPYIARLHHVCSSKRKIYMVMEYLSGGDLHDRVAKMGRLGEEEARHHFQRLIDAVHFCHRRGVYHRDLKLENLLLNGANEVKVTDFGLSAIRELDELSIASNRRLYSRVGTKGYQAPEIISPASYAGYSGDLADVWSCGVILFVLLAGYQPFVSDDKDENVLEMFQKIVQSDYECPTYFSQEVQSLIARLLQPDVRSRITTDEIYDNEWFQTSYVPPDFQDVQHVHADFGAIEAMFRQMPKDHEAFFQGELQPRSLDAFDLLGQMTPVDHALAPEFSRLGRDVRIKEETRFTSKLPVAEILQQIEAAAETLDFVVQVRDFQMKMEEKVQHIDKEPLSAVAEIFEVLPGLSMVILQKLRGDPADYQQFSKGLALRLKYRGITEIRLNYK